MRRRRLKNEEAANGAQEEVRRLLISLPPRGRKRATFRLSDFHGGAAHNLGPKSGSYELVLSHSTLGLFFG